MSSDRVALILDTDIGDDIDDLYALYLALFHPRLELRAVTTVFGDTQARARLVAKALRAAGVTDLPIGAGIRLSEARRRRGQTQPDPDRLGAYLDYVRPDDPEWGRTFPDAVELILRLLAESAQPLALVGIGAGSNLAAVVDRAGETLRHKIRALALMAGETQAVMNEHNVRCDPEAADRLLSSGLPVFLGTFQVTRRLSLSMEEVEAMFGSSARPVHRVLSECTRRWGPTRGLKHGPVLYDLAPLFWLADPANVRTRRSAIRVELEGQYTRGQTVRVADDGPVLESVDLDPAALRRQLLDIIGAAGRGG